MKIIIGHDGSEWANAAMDDLAWAGLPREGLATVITAADLWPHLTSSTFNVSQPLPMDVSSWIDPVGHNARAMARRAIEEAEEVAAQAVKRLKSILPLWDVHLEVVKNSPHVALVQKADECGADLLVVGSHGRSALGRLILGSVSQQVLTHARCSVRIARRRERASGPTRLLVGVDGSADSWTAVLAVARRNWPTGTEVKVCALLDRAVTSVVPLGGAMPLGWPFAAHEDSVGGMTRIASSAADQLKESGLFAEPIVHDGDPKKELVETARRWGADCIFVGAKGLSQMERFLLGSVSGAVATRAGCTVEVVRSR